MLATVLKKYPEHAICLRSVHDQSLLEQLQKVGFRLLPARQIYLSDTQTDAPFVNRRFHKDSKLLNKTSYRILRHHEINRVEASRLKELFERLHIEKYSRRNPQYTTRFIGHSLETKFLE
ncbi:MAG: hypothetical protein KDK65_06515, partial [Chlamydiia bacterium]|nr:hypothetical protein [Chlamydiia bacterium]